MPLCLSYPTNKTSFVFLVRLLFFLRSFHVPTANFRPLSTKSTQAHVCISNTSRAGAELGYDVSVLADGIGDRDIPGASAKQLVEVCFVVFSCIICFCLVGCKGSLAFSLSLLFFWTDLFCASSEEDRLRWRN